MFLLVFKPIHIHVSVSLLLALRKEAEHDASKAADGFCTEETVFHLCQCGEVVAVG